MGLFSRNTGHATNGSLWRNSDPADYTPARQGPTRRERDQARAEARAARSNRNPYAGKGRAIRSERGRRG